MDYEILQKMIDKAERIVFFGGAGVSTESGIKDFRGKDGLYNETYAYPPEVILSKSFFDGNTEFFYNFYREKLNALDVKPNIIHNYLKRLEDSGKDITIITQNIDGLHEKAGSKNVLLLHGSINNNYCIKCRKKYNADFIFKETAGVPICTCGGIIRPDVVLYEEPLNEKIVNSAISAIKNCDLLIVAGTSLVVYPAASFIRYFRHENDNKLVIINRDETSFDKNADLLIHKNMRDIFMNLK